MSFLLIIVFGVVSAIIYHFRVEKPRHDLVHRAMTEYQKVLDAEWSDPTCTLENCPKSSKSIPGVPSTRAQLTEAERWNLELRGPRSDSPPTVHMRSNVGIYNVKGKIDGSVTAIVYVSTWYYEEDTLLSGGSDHHQVELIPTDDGYVVMADDTLPWMADSKYLR
ncbi:MAG: hypothetical protein Q4A82_06265 [Corynebacterium sp.]|nr:hypothetical protein [Corynebacterium sp.]